MKGKLNLLGKVVRYDASKTYVGVIRIPEALIEDLAPIVHELDPKELEKNARVQEEMGRPKFFGDLVESELHRLEYDLESGKYHYICPKDDHEEELGNVLPEHRKGLENTIELYRIVLKSIGHNLS